MILKKVSVTKLTYLDKSLQKLFSSQKNYGFRQKILFTFLGGAPISICHFFHPSIRLSVAHQISGTIYHLIVIFGTYISNDGISRCFFHFLKILMYWAVRGVKGQIIVQNEK